MNGEENEESETNSVTATETTGGATTESAAIRLGGPSFLCLAGLLAVASAFYHAPILLALSIVVAVLGMIFVLAVMARRMTEWVGEVGLPGDEETRPG